MNGQIVQGPIQIKGGVLNMVTELKPFRLIVSAV